MRLSSIPLRATIARNWDAPNSTFLVPRNPHTHAPTSHCTHAASMHSTHKAAMRYGQADQRGMRWKSLKSGQLSLGVRYAFSYRSEENYIDFEKDYYEILGVDQKADLTQIKQKFYLLAKEYHPDKAKGQQAMFKLINEAYNVLSQSKLRQQYDANRNCDPKQRETGGGLGAESTHSRPLNYQPYSQMSRAQWAVLRQGYMAQSRVDYSNYQRTFSPQQDIELRMKEKEQWNRAFKSITKEQVLEEIQFREKLQKKHMENLRKQQEARDQFYQQKFTRIGDRIEKIFGKTARSIYDYLVRK